MLINIQTISGKGFMSFRKPFEFPIYNYVGKTVQIDGNNLDDEKSKSNGSGKSTLLETINWGLFGELCRKNRYKDEVISKKEKLATIQVIFKIDEISYKIERTIERKKTPSIRIWKEAKEILLGSTYQSKQLWLEQLLQMGFISFQCYIMFGRDFNNFPDLKPADRAKILSDIRGLDKYLEGSRKAGESSKSVWITLDQTGRELDNKTVKLTEIRTTSYKGNIDQFEQKRVDDILELDGMVYAKTEAIKEEEERVQKRSEIILDQIKSINGLIDDIMVDLPNEKAVTDNVYNYQSEMVNVLAQKNSLKQRINQFNEEITRLSKKGHGPCPFCGQDITGAYLQTRTNQLGLEVMSLTSKLDTVQEQEKRIRKELKINEELMSEIRTKSIEIEKFKNRKHLLEIDLAKIGQDARIATLREAVEQLKIRIENKRSEKNPYLDMEEKRKEKIKELGAEIRGIKDQINNLQTQKNYFDFWIDGFKKIRMMIFDTMISQLETLVQWYLSQYSSELNVIMTTERETRSGTIKDEFHISIVDSNGDEISYEMYSGGERQKIRLSISRALAQFIKESCGVDFNIIAFDEPNDALDDVGKDVNFDLFQELSEKEGKAVLVTDHDSVFKDKFDHNVLVIKEGGESTIHA